MLIAVVFIDCFFSVVTFIVMTVVQFQRDSDTKTCYCSCIRGCKACLFFGFNFFGRFVFIILVGSQPSGSHP